MNTISNSTHRALITIGLGLLTFGFSMDAFAVTTPYQRYLFSPKCSADLKTCQLDFPVVPANSRLEITNTSCYIQLKQNAGFAGELNYVQLLVKGGTGSTVSASTLAPLQIGQTSIIGPDLISYAANHTVSVFANAGQHFQVLSKVHEGTFDGSGGTALACHISGRLISP